MTDILNTPPAGTRWIMSRRDLPQATEPAEFHLPSETGQPRCFVPSKRNRQVLEALMAGPIFCASPVRLSDSVLILRRDYELNIETEFFTADDGTRFGVYHLRSRLSRAAIAAREAA